MKIFTYARDGMNAFILRLVLIAAFASTAMMAQGQTDPVPALPAVSTDLLDYSPGSTAIITGINFQPGEIVELHVHHADGDPLGTDPDFHLPWSITADASGNFTTSWYVPLGSEGGDALGATLNLEAHGDMGSVAQWTFTDAVPTITSIAPSASGSTNGGYIITITTNNNAFTTGQSPYSVNFGGVYGTSATRTGNKTLTVIVPAHYAGVNFITIYDKNNNTAAESGLNFTFVCPTILFTITKTSYNGADLSCNTSTDGVITIGAPSGGTAQYFYSKDNGLNYQASNVFSGLGAGTYQIAVKDINNCTTTTAVTITAPTAITGSGAVTSSYNGSQLSCATATDGAITVTAAGGTGTKTYSIDAGSYQASNVFTGLAAGTHTLSVKDANGCTFAPTSVTITAPTAITGSGTVTSNYNGSQLSCATATDGAITITATGGTGTRTYSIDAGSYQASNVFTGLAAGAHTLSVKDANGCTFAPASVTITAPTAISGSGAVTSNYFGSQISCVGSTDGAITVTATGGTGTKTYSIDAGSYQASNVFTGLGAGVHTLSVKDVNGCTFAPTSVTITAPAAINSAVASDYNGIYDGVSHNGSATVAIGETVDWYANATGLPTSVAPNGTNVGTYTAYAQARNTTTGCISASRTLVTVSISKAVLTVTADNKAVTYGDAVPTLTYSLSGFVNAETSSVVSGAATLSTTYTNATSVAASPVAITGILGTLSATNYSFNPIVNGNITIGQKSATVVADGKTKTYGDLNPALTAVVAGTVNSDVLNYSLATTAGQFSNVGSYPIAITLGSNPNYSVTPTNALLTVNKRAITITADGKSKYCGQVDPALTYSITSGNLVSTDAFAGSLTRDGGESLGVYLIKQGTVSLNSNYTLTYVGANLTINSITIDASASSVPVAVGSAITLYATVSPPVAGVSVTFTLDNGNGWTASYGPFLTNSLGVATSSLISGLPVEVYLVNATAGSGCGLNGTSIAYVPVYDPNGGFVTGGGWINSPAGAYTPNAALVGKANFGFVSKYKKGSTQVDGNTEFQFQTGNLNFKSTTNLAASLVIAGSQAIYKGTGTINGAGVYSFMVSAVDGQVSGGGGTDKFRIKIWDAAGTVYDNQITSVDNATATTVLGGGSIVIHSTKSGNRDAAPEEAIATQEISMATISVYPNPVEDVIHVRFASESKSPIAMQLIDLNGRSLRTESYQANEAGEYEMGVSNLSMNTGFYLLRIAQDNSTKTIKVLKR